MLDFVAYSISHNWCCINMSSGSEHTWELLLPLILPHPLALSSLSRYSIEVDWTDPAYPLRAMPTSSSVLPSCESFTPADVGVANTVCIDTDDLERQVCVPPWAEHAPGSLFQLKPLLMERALQFSDRLAAIGIITPAFPTNLIHLTIWSERKLQPLVSDLTQIIHSTLTFKFITANLPPIASPNWNYPTSTRVIDAMDAKNRGKWNRLLMDLFWLLSGLLCSIYLAKTLTKTSFQHFTLLIRKISAPAIVELMYTRSLTGHRRLMNLWQATEFSSLDDLERLWDEPHFIYLLVSPWSSHAYCGYTDHMTKRHNSHMHKMNQETWEVQAPLYHAIRRMKIGPFSVPAANWFFIPFCGVKGNREAGLAKESSILVRHCFTLNFPHVHKLLPRSLQKRHEVFPSVLSRKRAFCIRPFAGSRHQLCAKRRKLLNSVQERADRGRAACSHYSATHSLNNRVITMKPGPEDECPSASGKIAQVLRYKAGKALLRKAAAQVHRLKDPHALCCIHSRISRQLGGKERTFALKHVRLRAQICKIQLPPSNCRLLLPWMGSWNDTKIIRDEVAQFVTRLHELKVCQSTLIDRRYKVNGAMSIRCIWTSNPSIFALGRNAHKATATFSYCTQSHCPCNMPRFRNSPKTRAPDDSLHDICKQSSFPWGLFSDDGDIVQRCQTCSIKTRVPLTHPELHSRLFDAFIHLTSQLHSPWSPTLRDEPAVLVAISSVVQRITNAILPQQKGISPATHLNMKVTDVFRKAGSYFILEELDTNPGEFAIMCPHVWK